MGFSIGSLSLVRAGSARWKDARVLSLGNPFLTADLLLRAGFDSAIVKKVVSLSRNSRAKALFLDALKAKRFTILDISPEEEAELVLDLNLPVARKKIPEKFDAVLDLGTQEHVLNTGVLMQNVLNFLKDGGLYIFSLPANGFLEHGFRQYSPTFFYDLCHANKTKLAMTHLSLHHPKLIRGISVLPLYEKMDPKFSEVVDTSGHKFESTVGRAGIFTGAAIQLFNDLRGGVELIGVIQKKQAGQLKFAATQCLYRVHPLEKILPDKKAQRSFREGQTSFFKLFFNKLPAPAWLKIRCLVGLEKIRIHPVGRLLSRN